MKKYIICIIFTISLIVSFYGTVYAEITTYYNQYIPNEVKTEVNKINENIIKSLQQNNLNTLYDTCILDQSIDKNSFFKYYNYLPTLMNGLDLEKYDEFYVVTTNENNLEVLAKNKSRNYYLNYEGFSKETYIIMYKSLNSDGIVFMISFLYAKMDNSWKLQHFCSELKALGGKSTPDWLTEGKNLYDKGYNMSAFLRLNMAVQLATPTPYFHYMEEKEIESLSQELAEKIMSKISFPLELPNIKSQPTIYYIRPTIDGEINDLIPVIKYVTNIPLSYKENIVFEAQEITRELLIIFPEFEKVEKGIKCIAFSEPPFDEEKSYDNYSIVIYLQ